MDRPAPEYSIGLIAHDHMKHELIEWAQHNREILRHHELIATGTTGKMVREQTGLSVRRLKSGPMGGDQEMGALTANGGLDLLVFFWDPMQPQPHDPDVKALLRLAVMYNIPTACNRATADFIITSPLFADRTYDRKAVDYSEYLHRELE